MRNREKSKRGASWQVDYSKPFKNGPVDVGFDEAFFILSSLDMAPYLYLRNNKAISLPTVNKGFPHNEYNKYQRIGAAAADFEASDCLADWASESRDYVKRRAKDKKKKPFFLYLPLTSPHTPITPGAKFKGKYPQYSWYADFDGGDRLGGRSRCLSNSRSLVSMRIPWSSSPRTTDSLLTSRYPR